MIIMAHCAPVERLSRDIENLIRHDMTGPTTSQFELMCEAPAFNPSSARIVEVFVRSFGHRLFSRPYNLLLLALAKTGPLATAETMLLRARQERQEDALTPVIDGLKDVMWHRPDAMSSSARDVLARFMLKPPGKY
jgi:hypothetical protein